MSIKTNYDFDKGTVVEQTELYIINSNTRLDK